MAINEDLQSDVKSIFATAWATRNGRVVPDTSSVQLGNDAIILDDAIVLYADLAESTALVNKYKNSFAAEIYKAYLHCSAKIIRSEQGEITAYDGDRIMAVFIGENKLARSVRSTLKITYAVKEIINPAIKKQYPKESYAVRHAVGIDRSQLFVARTGIRGSNDLVWVGRAANYAAKLCSVREGSYSSFITTEIYDSMPDGVKFGGDPKRAMWEKWYWLDRGIYIYRSKWQWSL